MARELTKVHEEFRAGGLQELRDHYSRETPRGEITVLLSPAAAAPSTGPEKEAVEIRALDLLQQGISRKGVVQQLVEETGLPKNEIYRWVMNLPS